jgi:hypothetical protein
MKIKKFKNDNLQHFLPQIAYQRFFPYRSNPTLFRLITIHQIRFKIFKTFFGNIVLSSSSKASSRYPFANHEVFTKFFISKKRNEKRKKKKTPHPHNLEDLFLICF